MPKKTDMTERIYEYLQQVIPAQGYAPSVREICEAVGLKCLINHLCITMNPD